MERKTGLLNTVLAAFINSRHTDRKKLIRSILSLILALAVLVTGTYCWYYIKTATAEGNNFKLDAGKDLRVNDTGLSQFGSSLNDFKLIPASSVDGRNIFFPTDGTDFSDVTKDMTFRSANAGDKNVNYIQLDFQVTAQANLTSIYLDPKTSLELASSQSGGEVSSQQAAPLRMAIWCNAPDKNGNPVEPIVFNSQAKTVTTAAVSSIDRGSGKYLSNASQVAHQFSDYAIGGKPIATLSAGKVTSFSVIIWLEGCDPKCTWSKIQALEKTFIKLRLAFNTSWDNTEVVRFRDNSSSSWVAGKIRDGYTLTVRYEENVNVNPEKFDFSTYRYRDNSNEWMASIPSDMKNKVYFILSPPAASNKTDTYKFCKSDGKDNHNEGDDNTNRGVNRQYIVEDNPPDSADDYDKCRGHWVALGDSDGGGLDIGDLDGDDF